ncbi:nuclear transport factor 2 family protein [Jeotgalibacillus aurantiacus]|uniref:nuclear transport factor 2 family protein n=1 Tax=Jeotgalibacillus aurantiacus TaxID=2763266 RepID=UPI001D0BD7CD|nr:nuclear transport factor 2 family protein [Jeotgalibacillus aurantiacus]
MKTSWKTLLGAGLLVLALAGCSEDREEQNANSVTDGQAGQGAGQETHSAAGNIESETGITLDSEGNVQEAEDVPAEVEEEVNAVFDQYIETFNNEDLEGYLDLLLYGDDYYNEEEERTAVGDVFEQFDVNRTVVEKTISGYEEGVAEMFSNLELTTIDPASGTEVTRGGRQVTILRETDEGWKIASIQFIASPE